MSTSGFHVSWRWRCDSDDDDGGGGDDDTYDETSVARDTSGDGSTTRTPVNNACRLCLACSAHYSWQLENKRKLCTHSLIFFLLLVAHETKTNCSTLDQLNNALTCC